MARQMAHSNDHHNPEDTQEAPHFGVETQEAQVETVEAHPLGVETQEAQEETQEAQEETQEATPLRERSGCRPRRGPRGRQEANRTGNGFGRSVAGPALQRCRGKTAESQ